jgi:hypothetical protein
MCSLRWTTEVLVVERDEVKLSCSVLFTVCCLHNQGVHTVICSMCHRIVCCCCEKDCQRIDGSRVEDSTSATWPPACIPTEVSGVARCLLCRGKAVDTA